MSGSWGDVGGSALGGWGSSGLVDSESWGTPDIDALPPWIDDQAPEASAEDVAVQEPIVFAVKDDHDIVLGDIRVYVDSLLVFNGSTLAWTSGWGSSQYFPNTENGFDFLLIHDALFEFGSSHTIRVLARDTSALELDASWTFSCAGKTFAGSGYQMLIRSVRAKDERSPGVLQNIFESEGGIDDTWEQRLYEPLTNLASQAFDPATVNAQWLPWLKANLGLSRDIPFVATEQELRRVLLGVPSLWRHKPSEQALKDAIRLVTGNKFKIRNYFDFRMAADTTILTEILEDFDPNLLDFPGVSPSGNELFWCFSAATYPCTHRFRITDLPTDHFPGGVFTSADQYQYLQIVEWLDDPTFEGVYRIDSLDVGLVWGTVLHTEPAGPNSNKQGKWRLWGENSDFITEARIVSEPSNAVNSDLLTYLVDLSRPYGERIDVVLLDFLDEFITPKDLDQWTLSGGADASVPSPGCLLYLPASAVVEPNKSFASAWTQDRTVAFKVQGLANAALEMQFLRVDDDNHYSAEIDWTAQTLSLKSRVAAVPTVLGTVTRTDILPGYDDVIRCNLIKEGTNNRLQVKFNGELVLEAVDAPASFTTGTIGLRSSGTATAYAKLVEAMILPVSSFRIGPQP